MPQQSPDRGNRLTEYVRPTVYTPHDASPRRPPRRRSAAVARVVRATLGALIFLVGVPALLWIVGGDPVARLPAWPQVAAWFDQPNGRLTPAVLTGAVIWVLWLAWAAFALLLVADVLAVVTRWRLAALRLPAPLHRLVFGLAGTAAIAVTSAGPLTGGVGRASAVVATADGAIPRQAVAQGPAVIQVADTRYVYTVERHDTLSKIAKEWLGDTKRWPEICRLNKHRHFAGAGGTLRDCDLIYPGWELRLPADARPPAAARPLPPPDRPEPDPGVRPADPAPPGPSTAAPSPNDGVYPGPAATADAATAAPRPGHRTDDRSSIDDDGVHLPQGGYLPWALAAAISAAAALVWRHRRRRYVPGTRDLDPADLPAPVDEITRQVRRHPEPPQVDDLPDRATAPPELPVLPPQGVGLVGDGAHAAARAALTTTLATTGDNDQRMVITDRPTLATLLGPEPVHLHTWERLHLAEDPQAALTAVEAQLLQRARIRDERTLTTTDPADPPPPQLLLLATAPAPQAHNRTRTLLDLGAEHGITGLLLGQWPHGTTIDVSADGAIRTITGHPSNFFGDRAALLDRDATLAILQTLREAHTGEPPPQPAPPTHTTAEPVDSTDGGEPDRTDPEEPAASTDQQLQTAQLRVLGAPRVDNISQPGRPLRAKAAELAVFLACHPDGADTATIAEYLVPDARLRAARQQIHTNVSNLRHVLTRAGGPRPGGYLLKGGTNDRYRLDPSTVDVDLWRLHDLLRRAPLATRHERVAMLREACALYTAPLADGCDYEWIEPHREKARRWALDAHALLADELLADDPQAASDLLDRAIEIDRYNEEIYRAAMRARHALGDRNGVQALLQALSAALADLDTPPSTATVSLARELTARPE